MQGLFHAELLRFIEHTHDYALVDQLIEATKLPNDGAYTSAHTYDDEELERLLKAYCLETGHSRNQTLEGFGIYLAPILLSKITLMIDMQTVDQHSSQTFHLLLQAQKIHEEYLKRLFFDPPSFIVTIKEAKEHELVLQYISQRRLEYLGKGIITGIARHFNEPIEITINQQDSETLLSIRKQA